MRSEPDAETKRINNATAPAAETMTFEQALVSLQRAADRLEAGDLPLEEAMLVYEEGVRLARRCTALLDQAELKVRELLALGEEGEPGTEADERFVDADELQG